MPITSLSDWRQIRTRGIASTPQQSPAGFGGVVLNSGQLRFDVTAGDPGTERGVMRSEIAGNPLPRYGRHGLRVTFMVPAFWAQDSGVFCLTAVPDPDDAVIHNSPLAVCIKGDRLRIAKRSDPNPASPPSITPVTLTVTGSLVTAKVYDGTTAATMTNGTVVGTLAGDVLALTQVGNFSSANVGGTAWAVTANESVAVTSSNRSSVATDYSVTQPVGLTGNITKRTVTLSATQTYTAATALSNVTIGNLVGNQTLGYMSATANSSQVSSNGANFITAITLTNGANGGLVGNYQLPTLNLANAPVTINKAPLGISANGTYKGSATYANLSGGAGLIQYNGTMGGETITSVTVTVANASVVANNYITSMTVLGGTANMNNYVLGSSYNATLGNTLNSFVMAKVNLGITANSTSTQYGLGTTLGTTAFTSTGLVNSETIGGVTLTSTGSAATAAVGSYSITPTGLTSSNYSLNLVSGTLTVKPMPLTVATGRRRRTSPTG